MKTRIIILIILFLSNIHVSADNKIEVKGEVYEVKVGDALVGATVKLLNAADSAFVTAVVAKKGTLSNGTTYYSPKFSITLPDRNRKYILEVSYTGYEPYFADIDPASVSKKQYYIDLDKIFLSPVVKHLGEISVVATKVKFYNRGDTLVYNADAFNLAEGSMLDALIRQLPNVRLTEQGEIFVNGNKVESLLLNGKDFFGPDRQIMLNNLGAYMVKNVEVYNKAGFQSEVTGVDTGDRQLVMDVRLKKEYMYSLIGNIEGGYGTHDRYMARAFTGSFAKVHSAVLYVNMNNVNASQAPQENSSWRPETMPTGIRNTTQAGFKYWYDSPDTKWSVGSANDFNQVKEDDGTDTYRTNYLNSGNTFENSFRRSHNKTIDVSTYTQVDFKNLKGYGFRFIPQGSYSHWDRNASDAMATFNQNLENITAPIVESIYDGNDQEILKYLINRDIELSKLHGHSWKGAGDLLQTIALPNSSDAISIIMRGNYQSRKDDRFERFEINYGQDKDPAHLANRYYKNYPDFNSSVSAQAKYVHYLDKSTFLQLAYEYEHKYSKNTSELYRLDMLDSPEADLFGYLPSAIDYKMAIDNANSYLSRNTADDHRIIPRIEHNTDQLGLWCEIPVYFSHSRLHYLRGSIDSRISKDWVYINHAFFGARYRKDKNTLHWQGIVNSSLPNLVNMVDMTDATDPLNIVVGNPDLKRTTEFNTEISFSRFVDFTKSMTIKLRYSQLFNALARGYI